jgi:hypothetical protein
VADHSEEPMAHIDVVAVDCLSQLHIVTRAAKTKNINFSWKKQIILGPFCSFHFIDYQQTINQEELKQS